MTKLGDPRDRRFILFDQLQIQDLTKYPKFADHGRDIFEMVLSEAEKFAENVLWPLNQKGDEEGCHFEKGEVRTPQGFKEAYDQYVEGGWLTPADDPEWGGQNLPQALCTACHECFHGSNTAFSNYPNLTHGAGMMIEKHGTARQKELYLKRLWSGEWSGTMCLTEPGAGSDLGILKTKAIPRPDGTYLIQGVKTFITAGQHDLRPNIIHPVLARIEGDPPGPKGISLFIPKVEDGKAKLGNSRGSRYRHDALRSTPKTLLFWVAVELLPGLATGVALLALFSSRFLPGDVADGND
jgi:alkylation response protein AidB-like acyl-CoA dehydrogenase